MYLHFKLCENPPSGFLDATRKSFLYKKSKNLFQFHNLAFRKKN